MQQTARESRERARISEQDNFMSKIQIFPRSGEWTPIREDYSRSFAGS
jgi:hypothetical protein